MDQVEKAHRLRELHGPAHRPLVFCNVWDAASARIVEQAGFPAIATGSAGVAFSLGYPDGEKIPVPEMMAAIHRIVRAVRVPVTADVESGYDDVADTVRALVDTGAVGMNLEDCKECHQIGFKAQLDKIEKVRNTAERVGVPVFLNARCDIYLEHIGEPSTRLDRTIERIRAYANAGADCVFVPGVKDEKTIKALVTSVDVPLNILGTVGSPSVTVLRGLGVARISVGSGPMRATMALTRYIANELRYSGLYDAFTRDTIPYDEANELFKT